MTACKNCNATFEGKYCPNCSQRADTHRLTLWHFIHETFHAFTHTDKGIFFLIKEMVYKPGTVAIEYNAGKRKKYFSPFTFFLIVVAVEIFASQKTDFYKHYASSLDRIVQGMNQKSIENSSNAHLEGAKTKVAKMSANSRLITFVFLPVLALLTWLFFKKSGNNYAENLVFNVLIQGQLMVYYLLICIIPFLIDHSVVLWVLLIYIITTWVFSFYAYHQFFRQSWFKTIIKGIAIQIVYFIVIEYGTSLIFHFV